MTFGVLNVLKGGGVTGLGLSPKFCQFFSASYKRTENVKQFLDPSNLVAYLRHAKSVRLSTSVIPAPDKNKKMHTKLRKTPKINAKRLFDQELA